MRPRILRLRRFGNRAALEAAHTADPELTHRTVVEQQAALDAAHGPFSVPLVRELAELGWDTSELILGVPSIRDAWEREHGPIPPVAGIEDPDVLLALAEARRFRPDVVLDSNLNVLDRVGARVMRDVVGPRAVLAGYLGTEKRFHRALALDLSLVACGSMAEALRPFANGPVEVLPHAFDPAVVATLPERRVARPLVFAGALGPRYVERHRVLMALLEQTELEAWVGLRKGVRQTDDGWLVTDGARPTPRRTLRSRATDLAPTAALAKLAGRSSRAGEVFNARIARLTGGLVGPEAPLRDPRAVHPERCHAPVSGRDYLMLLRSAGTVLHRGIDALGGCGGALRLFEATGVGAALLVEDSAAVRELFRAGDEVITYRDPADAVAKATWLSERPEVRERIAVAGHRRTLADHTPAARARTLDPLLRDALARRRARRTPPGGR